MKKIFAMLLAVCLLLSLAACGSKTNKPADPGTDPTTAPAQTVTNVEGTMEEILNKIVEIQPVEFMGGTMPIDLTDKSEDGLWNIKYNTGLDNADNITDAAMFGPMMGSMAYSMVTVRVKEGADVAAVAEGMKTGIDPRKWICVEADDLQVVSYGDVVMLIMVASDSGMTSQSFVDAFAQVCGGNVTVH